MENFAIGVGVGVVVGGGLVYVFAARALAFVQRIEAAAARVERAAKL